MDMDYLYHLGLTKLDAEMFKDIKYVCVGEGDGRMTNFTNSLPPYLGLD